MPETMTCGWVAQKYLKCACVTVMTVGGDTEAHNFMISPLAIFQKDAVQLRAHTVRLIPLSHVSLV